MQHKFFEIRDRMTCIPVLGVNMSTEQEPLTDVERAFLHHAGYGPFRTILLCRLGSGPFEGRCDHDPYAWNDRTMARAHQYIEEQWEQLKEGDVVSVEHLKGERTGDYPEPEIYRPEGTEEA